MALSNLKFGDLEAHNTNETLKQILACFSRWNGSTRDQVTKVSPPQDPRNYYNPTNAFFSSKKM